MYIEKLGRGKRLRGGVNTRVDSCWLLYRMINWASPDMGNAVLRGHIFRIVSGYERQLHYLVVGKLVIGIFQDERCI